MLYINLPLGLQYLLDFRVLNQDFKEDYKTNLSITPLNALEFVGAENEVPGTRCLVPGR